MKRTAAILLCAVIATLLFAGCDTTGTGTMTTMTTRVTTTTTKMTTSNMTTVNTTNTMETTPILSGTDTGTMTTS